MSKALEYGPNPLAFETKPTTWGREQTVVLVKKQTVAFKSEALMNENLSLTCGAMNDACDKGGDLSNATETTIGICSPNPQAVLQYNDECEIHAEVKQDVNDISVRTDAADDPYKPAISIIELPVDAATLGIAPLTSGAV